MSDTRSSPQRIDWFDALRVLATLAVIALHLSAQFWAETDVTSRAWFAMNLYDSAVRWAMPSFVMISGALFLSGAQGFRVILRKNALRLVTAFVFWSAAYALYARAFYGEAWEDVLFRFVTGHYHMWFLFMIVGLYLLVPLLRPIAREVRLERYFLLLALVFTFLLPQLAALLRSLPAPFDAAPAVILSYLSFSFTRGFVPYFLAGHYFTRQTLSRRAERCVYALGLIGFVGTLVLTRQRSIAAGAATEQFYGYNTLNVLAMTLAVFLLARRYLAFPALGVKGRARIRALSRWSFGAYLIHPMVIETMQLRWGVTVLSCNVFFSIPLLTLLVGALSFLLSAMLHRIPVVQKYLV